MAVLPLAVVTGETAAEGSTNQTAFCDLRPQSWGSWPARLTRLLDATAWGAPPSANGEYLSRDCNLPAGEFLSMRTSVAVVPR